MEMLKLKYLRLTGKLEAGYHVVRQYFDLEDTTETRHSLGTFLGVVSCVGIFYTVVILEKLLCLASQATQTVVAIITQ